MRIPTLEQKKAVIRVLGDLIRHDKAPVSDEDYAYFLFIGSKVLKLKEEDILDSQNERFALTWFSLIGELSQIYQIAFRQLMIAILTHNGRTPSFLERTDFEKYLSVLPNPDGSLLSIDVVKKCVSNKLAFLNLNNNRLLPWL
jgi:hypothetical protein